MNRLALLSLVALLAVGCQDQTAPSPPPPSAVIMDGTDLTGNPDFFFLRPISDPSGDPNLEAGEFNPAVSPVVRICEGIGARPGSNDTECAGLEVAEFTMFTGPGSETVRLSAADEHYIVNWHTDLFALDPAFTYRIRVLLGGEVLGFADVELGATRGELKNVNSNDMIPLLDGRTLPIKFRIEDAALCRGPTGGAGAEPCSSGTIVLANGGNVVLEETGGDRLDIPPQPGSTRIVTYTLSRCPEDIAVDLPKFGDCLRIRSDETPDAEVTPPAFDPPAIVSICGELPELPPTTQDDLLRLHRQDAAGNIQALPFVLGFCTPTSVGDAGGNLLLRFARAGWRAVRDGLASLFVPRTLYARSIVVIDVGGGGETEFTSDFQFALPAQMEKLEGDNQQAAVEGTVPVPPAVLVTDQTGAAVAGATVRFAVTSSAGSVAFAGVPCGSNALLSCVQTGTDGIARVTSWTLGPVLAPNTLGASGRGIADPEDGGPFLPGETPVPVEIGMVEFHAFAFQDVAATRVDVNHYLLNLRPGFYPDATFHGADILFSGGLSYGNSSTNVLIYNTRTGESDFTGPDIRVFRPGPLAAHQTRTVMTEAPTASPPGKAGLGLRIVRETFAFTGAADEDYVIVKYTIHNGESMMSGVHIGEIIDADIGGLPEPSADEINDDFVEFVSAPALRMARVTSAEGDPRLGFILLSDAVTSYRAWRNPSVAGPAPVDPITNAEWFTFLSGGITGPDLVFGPTDVRHLLSHGPVSIAPGAARVVAVGLVGADTDEALAANVAAARAKWLTLPAGPTPLP